MFLLLLSPYHTGLLPFLFGKVKIGQRLLQFFQSLISRRCTSQDVVEMPLEEDLSRSGRLTRDDRGDMDVGSFGDWSNSQPLWIAVEDREDAIDWAAINGG